MKNIIFLVFSLLFFSGCDKIIENELISIVEDLDGIKKFNDGDIELCNNYYLSFYKIYEFRVIKSGKHIYAVEDEKGKIRVFSCEDDILQYIKPRMKAYAEFMNRNIFIKDRNYTILQLISAIDKTVLINQEEDINGLSDNDRKAIKKVKIYPIKRKSVGKDIEYKFFTWDFSKLELIENRIVFSESSDMIWEKKIIAKNIGTSDKTL